MRVEHLAIDGSAVTVEADADLGSQATATGWAIVPSLMRSHPFAIYPPGHSDVLEETVLPAFQKIEVASREEYSIKGGRLRVAELRMPTATGGTRTLTVGGWESRAGCLVTSLSGSERAGLVEVFDSLRFGESAGGLAIDSTVLPEPRAPEVVKEVPGLGILTIRPAIHSQLERVPKARGFATDHGELFRIRRSSDALLFVGRSAVVTVTPVGRVDTREMVALARDLRVEWSPRAGRARGG
jgi:hypothetical protein